MTPEITNEELDAAVEACAGQLLWEAGVVQPPVDAFKLATRLGLLIAEDEGLATRGRYARVGEEFGESAVGVVLLAPEQRPERRQWAVAHEVGEWAAGRVFERLGMLPSETPPSAREAVANLLAGSLLAPRRWFDVDARDGDWDLFALKACYSTASHELLARRTLQRIGQPAIVTIVDQGTPTWRRDNFGRGRLPMTPEEQRIWRACHRSGEPLSSGRALQSVERIRCWPVHEPGWRREVLLTELAEDL